MGRIKIVFPSSHVFVEACGLNKMLEIPDLGNYLILLIVKCGSLYWASYMNNVNCTITIPMEFQTKTMLVYISYLGFLKY